jgi:uncharacterized metal-binding protein
MRRLLDGDVDVVADGLSRVAVIAHQVNADLVLAGLGQLYRRRLMQPAINANAANAGATLKACIANTPRVLNVKGCDPRSGALIIDPATIVPTLERP